MNKKVNRVLVTMGEWNSITWKFFAGVYSPEIELCTAAFCIVTFKKRLVLVKQKNRGYEFAGGHVDSNEAIIDTVIREVREESQAVIETPIFFGYKEISPEKPIPHRDKPDQFYPFPNSYIPYFYAEAQQLLKNQPLADDVESIRLTTFDEAKGLLKPGHNHDLILAYLVDSELINVR